jgi:Tol biopolymer transport system component/DNA-binding winged helix-turn-helix (wHTH) protein
MGEDPATTNGNDLTPASHKRVRFGTFEVDLRAGEVRKGGLRIKLHRQPFEVLAMLLERPGEVVTREELQQKLWLSDTFVDFEHGLNKAINKLREALGDDADNPRYIETLPRRGYRFVGPIAPPVQDTVTEEKREESSPGRSRRKLWGKWWKFAALIGGVPLLAGLGAYLLSSRPRIHSDTLRPVPFTTYPGYESSPSFSPDGNEIVFVWFQPPPANGGDLYVKQIGQERAVRLTNHEAAFLAPAWSPDGRNIAFAMAGKDGNGIYLLPALGGPERRLVNFGDSNPWPLTLSWSAESRRLVFAKADPPTILHRVHVVDVETAEERVLPVLSPDCLMSGQPTFSPNGKYLASACVLAGSGGNRIYVQRAEGGGAHEVTLVRGPSFKLNGLAWTADSRSLVYSAEGSLWRVPATGGTPERLPFAHDAETPTVASVGNRLAYAQTSYHPDIWRIELATQKKPTGPASKLILSNSGQTNPRISPDGKRIAFESWLSGNHELWLCDANGSNLAQMSFFGETLTGTPSWSPDSHSIVFDSRASGHQELYVVSVDGGRPQKLVTGTPNASTPSWSSDGRWIYFLSEPPMAVWKVPKDGGIAVRLTKEGYYPQESPDGERVFYVVGGHPSELWSVPVNGGDERREEGMPTLQSDAHWTPAQGGIYFININGSQEHFSIYYFDFSTRHIDKVSELPGLDIWGGISVSSDGRTLLFSAVDHYDSDIMLVEGFR